MTRERIEDMRVVVLPFVKKRLLETNYEGLGESDAEMFAKDFNEILDLAIKALEQEPFINKPCVSSGVCEHDKQKILDKIRAEIDHVTEIHSDGEFYIKNFDVKRIIDKYKAESENP